MMLRVGESRCNKFAIVVLALFDPTGGSLT